MNSSEIRQKFLDFFEAKGHKIVSSAPIVVKNDPTLMFTNAGMNQFKDYFLGNKIPTVKRVANSQKCLRVSGKHNDLEEVGVDTYHHTMFEMLGNWSFGDYFKKEAIQWAWELLTEVYGLDKDRLYVTVFEGSKSDNLDFDTESFDCWEMLIEKDRILRGNKKDNFWEMGDTGPCGPCSEIHYDLRPDHERKITDGATLVNNDHPQVIEIWNNVFMQYNRKADGSLENLPDKHVDTGMGFERLVRAIHGKSSNYDTDIFLESITELEKISGMTYGALEKTDIAFRVISDHIRALCFTIADGQLPSNNGAGYVIRRILRRAVRYGYSSLGFKNAALFQLVQGLALKFKAVFPELWEQKDFVSKVIKEEETAFLKTLSKGIDILADIFKREGGRQISGKEVFELYDTFGFPIDLTRLIASENGFEIDEKGFEEELLKQKNRSRKDAEKITGDWVVLKEDDGQEFIGYDYLEAELTLCRYRSMEVKGKTLFQAVFNLTPFYAESGGQVGDTGWLTGIENDERIRVINTTKENNLFVHHLDRLPEVKNQSFRANVEETRRQAITKNHSATHLLHAALKEVLGNHIAQKGSLVEPERLRFDFSHFSKVSEEELGKIAEIVAAKIRENIPLEEKRDVPLEVAKAMGATALFGEKYGDTVRVIVFDPKFSMELCGGTHVANTAAIGRVVIMAESAVAAGVRRIEAISGEAAEQYIDHKLAEFESLHALLQKPKEMIVSVQNLLEENARLKKEIQGFELEKTAQIKQQLKGQIQSINGVNSIVERIEIGNSDLLKDLCFQLKNETENLFAVLATSIDDKPFVAVVISDEVIKQRGWNAGQLIREWAKEIDGGGGGQPFYAMAGGKRKQGLESVLKLATSWVQST